MSHMTHMIKRELNDDDLILRALDPRRLIIITNY